MLEHGSICTAFVIGGALTSILLILRVIGILKVSYWWVFFPLLLAIAYTISVVLLLLWIISSFLGG